MVIKSLKKKKKERPDSYHVTFPAIEPELFYVVIWENLYRHGQWM